jgi:hypothetical protein
VEGEGGGGGEGGVERGLKEVLGREMDEDRVRVVGWLEAEPAAVLTTGRVVCSVHHGGANSYYEAVVCVGPLPLTFAPEFLADIVV